MFDSIKKVLTRARDEHSQLLDQRQDLRRAQSSTSTLACAGARVIGWSWCHLHPRCPLHQEPAGRRLDR
jgi:hypothetical protein